MNISKKPILSKSDYLRYLQCPKYLWLNKNRKDLLPTISLSQDAIFEQGYEVEAYSHQLFAEGVEVKGNFDEARNHTMALIKEGRRVIFQATAFSKPILARVDILAFNPEEECWDIYEVKSTTEFKKEHIPDIAFQKYAFELEGLTIGKCFLIHINKEYVRSGDIDPHNLLSIQELTNEVNQYYPLVEGEAKKALDWLNSETEPKKRIGKQCKKPYPCPFKSYCWKDVPEHSVFEVSRISEKKLEELLDQEVLKIKDIPDEFILTENQRLHVDAVKNGKSTINHDEIKRTLDELEYPLYFLDYESCSPAIPLFDGIRSFQQLCFQYSLHSLEEDGKILHHKEFLATSQENPIPELLKQLRMDIGPKGTVIVWFKPFEKGRNSEMAELYPEYADFLNDVNSRVFDLMDVFKNGHFVHPDFRGSNSIKKVLPVLAPEFSHKTLNIQDGGTASATWFRMVHRDDKDLSSKETIKSLLEYCKLDTMAMVVIWKRLKEECL
jgi:hypothetical protein